MKAMKIEIFQHGPISYEGGPTAFWTNKGTFIPLKSCRLLRFLKDEAEVLWIAYAPSFKWVYISEVQNDFLGYLESNVKNQEAYKVLQNHQDPNNSSGWIYELENNLTLNYSYRDDQSYGPHLTLKFTNNQSEKAFTNSKTFDERAYKHKLMYSNSGERELTSIEQNVLNNPANDFKYGEFTSIEPRLPTWVKVVIVVLVMVLLAWLGDYLSFTNNLGTW